MEDESPELKEVPVTYRTMQIEETLKSHEIRISSNEKFRLMAQGAIAVLAFMFGAGGIGALILYIIQQFGLL